jgi:L-lysine exporter family protein LysE/ArgO
VLPFYQGLGIGAGLIIAIGAQNAFVLSQGVKRQYQWSIALICSACDAVLILAGVAGVGAFIASHPQVALYTGRCGAAFLFCYGLRALIAAFRNNALTATERDPGSFKTVVLTTLALTLLNPHVYLDTVVLLGSISGRFEGTNRYLFGIGACTASFVWFFSLSLGGGLLAPLFRHPLSWRILDFSIWGIMWAMAYSIWPHGV